MTATVEACIRHPQRPAAWACGECNARYCEVCMSAIAQARGGRLCPHCGGRCRETNQEALRAQAAEERQRKELSMKLEFPLAFVYPFRGRGKWALLFGTILFMMVRLAGMLGVFGLLLGIGQIIIVVGVTGYLLGYMMKIIGDSANGESEPPDWPDMSDSWNDILVPYGRVLSCVVISFLPLVAMIIGIFSGTIDDSPLVRMLLWSLLLVGATYLPMALLAANLFESVGAINPVRVLGGIFHYRPKIGGQ